MLSYTMLNSFPIFKVYFKKFPTLLVHTSPYKMWFKSPYKFPTQVPNNKPYMTVIFKILVIWIFEILSFEIPVFPLQMLIFFFIKFSFPLLSWVDQLLNFDFFYKRICMNCRGITWTKLFKQIMHYLLEYSFCNPLVQGFSNFFNSDPKNCS